MSFQQTIFRYQGSGVIGGMYSDAPRVVETYILNSADPANNVYGRVFSKDGTTSFGGGTLKVFAGGTPLGSTSFAGFLVNPKVTASFGTVAGGPLAPTLTLANGQIGEFLTRGFIYVTLPAPANVGDYVFYMESDGTLYTAPATITSPVPPILNSAFAHARVALFNAGPGLSVIEVIDVPYQEYKNP